MGLLFFTLCFYTSWVNASFNVTSSDLKTYMVFDDYTALAELNKGKISFDKFSDNIVKDIVKSLDKHFDCATTSLSIHSNICRHNDFNTTVNVYVPEVNFCEENTNCPDELKLLLDFNNHVTDKMSEISVDYFYLNVSGFSVSHLTFFSEEKLNKFEYSVDLILDTLNGKDRGHEGCYQTLITDNFPYSSSSWDRTGIDLPTCLKGIKDFFYLVYFASEKNSFLDDDEKFRGFDLTNAKFFSAIKSKYTQNQINNIIFSTLVKKFSIGQRVDYSIDVLHEKLGFTLYENLYEKKSIRDSLEYLNGNFTGVSYNGAIGFHEYDNMELFKVVFDLAVNASKKPVEFRMAIDELNLSDLFRDTNTVDEQSRVEPIDLVSNMMYRLKKKSFSETYESRIPTNYKGFIKTHLMSLAGLVDEPEVLTLIRRPKDNAPAFQCRVGEDQKIRSFSSGEIYLLDNFAYYSADFSDNGELLEFKCGRVPYQLSRKVIKEAPLAMPKQQSFTDGYVDIIMPFGLVSEINEEFQGMAKVYFQMMGFKIEEELNIDTAQVLLSELESTDVFIPVGHALGSRALNVGTKKSNRWTMTREAEEGTRQGVRLQILLPVKSSGRLELSSKDLSSAYKVRIDKDKDPLLVFIQTCHGEGNLPVWSLIYRNALRMGGTDNGSFPYVIASKRGFGTSSNIEIASNVLYPTDLADLLSQGKTPEEITGFFKSRDYGMFSDELIAKLTSRGMPKAFVKATVSRMFENKDAEISNFEPVFNFSEENAELTLRNSGTQFLLTRDNGEVILDETF